MQVKSLYIHEQKHVLYTQINIRPLGNDSFFFADTLMTQWLIVNTKTHIGAMMSVDPKSYLYVGEWWSSYITQGL
jgi:hypothetical protein